jgi:hypothetical protein
MSAVSQVGLCDISVLLNLIPIKAGTSKLDLALSGKRGRMAWRLTGSPDLGSRTKECKMSSDQDGKKPTGVDVGASAEQDAAPEQADGLEAVKPHLTGMIGMHIDQPQEDAATGSPGADTDRDLAEEK